MSEVWLKCNCPYSKPVCVVMEDPDDYDKCRQIFKELTENGHFKHPSEERMREWEKRRLEEQDEEEDNNATDLEVFLKRGYAKKEEHEEETETQKKRSSPLLERVRKDSFPI